MIGSFHDGGCYRDAGGVLRCTCGAVTTSPRAAAYAYGDSAAVDGMDTWLDHFETILTAIGQRTMTGDQTARFGTLLARGDGIVASSARIASRGRRRRS